MGAFRKNVLGLLAGQASRLALQAAYFVVLARMLGASGYGAFASALALAALAGPFSSLGTNTLMLKNVSRRHEAAQIEWKRAFFYTAVGGVLFAGALTGLAHLIAPPELSRVALFQIAAAELVGLKLVELTGSVWQGLGRSRPLILLPTIVNLLRLAAALTVFLSLGLASLDMWATLYLLVTLPVGVIVAVHTTLKLGYAKSGLRLQGPEVREGLLYAFAMSSQNVYNDIDKAMLARMSSVSAAGIYSAAYRIIDMAYAPIRSVAAAAYPLYFREGEGGLASALRLTRKIAPAVIGLGFTAAAAAALSAPLAPLLLGSDYGDAVEIIRLLAPLVLLRGLTFLAADTLTGCGRQGFRTVAQIGVAVLNVSVNLMLIPVAGVLGAVVSTVLCEGILAAILWSRIWVSLAKDRKLEAAEPLTSISPEVADNTGTRQNEKQERTSNRP
jgi:O-antigen/teichoic acid export membrane protein